MSKTILTHCTVEGCNGSGNLDSRTGKRYFNKGWCYKHWRRWYKSGDYDKVQFNIDGHSSHPLYRVYSTMKSRCYSKTNRRYGDWGARGIRVCDRWLGKDGFENFLEDMGGRPEKHSIDRIDNAGDYEPSNCRWATIHQQSANKRNNTPVVGVSWNRARNAWDARLNVDGHVVFRKRFYKLDEAIKARKQAEKDYLLIQ